MKFTKNLIIAVLLLIFALASFAYAASSPAVYLNGTKINETSIVKYNSVYLPVKTLASALGANIEYNAKSNCAKVNGNIIQAIPATKDGKTYLPVKQVANAVGATVVYDKKTNSVKITAKAASAKPSVVKVKPITTVETVVVKKPATEPKPAPAGTPAASSEDEDLKPFIPRSATNGIFKITVTNVETTNVIKGSYGAKPGFKYIIVYFSQQNVTDKLQTYLGKFRLMDTNNNYYGWTTGLSNYWVIVLRPGGISYGYLVFEIPTYAKHQSLYLDMSNRPPITVSVLK